MAEALTASLCAHHARPHWKRTFFPAKFTIANNYSYCFGTPPKCLLVLTDIEPAYLTPVRTHGYCVAFTGRKCKKLKGSLLYYKADIASVEALLELSLTLMFLGCRILHLNISCHLSNAPKEEMTW
jgi:hypothetical protein